MNKKILALMVTILAACIAIMPVNGQGPTFVWPDKSAYTPGESGTLYITFHNNLGDKVSIYNITITFELWSTYRAGKWEGNYTLEINTVYDPGETLEEQIEFTVPTDGRAKSTWVTVHVDADTYIPDTDYYVEVVTTPKYMEQIITLFTIQVVLLIVCTIIIAATIFLSARRPRITWKAEEKVEQA